MAGAVVAPAVPSPAAAIGDVPPDGTVSEALLEVVRDTADDVQDRWIRLRVDDGAEEILRYGETLRRALTPGRHRVRAHNTLSSTSIDIDAEPGETVRIRCYNHFARGGALMMLTIGFAFIKVRLERIS